MGRYPGILNEFMFFLEFLNSPWWVADCRRDPEGNLQFVVWVAEPVTPQHGVEPVVGAGLDRVGEEVGAEPGVGQPVSLTDHLLHGPDLLPAEDRPGGVALEVLVPGQQPQ